MNTELFNILVAIATGSVAVAVHLLIGISKNVNSIDKKISRFEEKFTTLEKTADEHAKDIKYLQKIIR